MLNKDTLIVIISFCDPKTINMMFRTNTYFNNILVQNANLISKNLLLNYNKFKITYYKKSINFHKDNKGYSFSLIDKPNWFYMFNFCNST